MGGRGCSCDVTLPVRSAWPRVGVTTHVMSHDQLWVGVAVHVMSQEQPTGQVWSSLVPRPREGERKTAWDPLFAHAPTIIIKPGLVRGYPTVYVHHVQCTISGREQYNDLQL